MLGGPEDDDTTGRVRHEDPKLSQTPPYNPTNMFILFRNSGASIRQL